jgi:hypothetical protein
VLPPLLALLALLLRRRTGTAAGTGTTDADADAAVDDVGAGGIRPDARRGGCVSGPAVAEEDRGGCASPPTPADDEPAVGTVATPPPAPPPPRFALALLERVLARLYCIVGCIEG